MVTSCAWLPNSTEFISGSQDKHIYLWSITGEILHRWSGIRVHDLGLSSDGATLIAITEKKLVIYDLSRNGDRIDELPLKMTLTETDAITSVSVKGKYALVNLCTQEIHLWDLEKGCVVRKYVGQKQGRFVIRSCFGGEEGGFVLSGSEGLLLSFLVLMIVF